MDGKHGETLPLFPATSQSSNRHAWQQAIVEFIGSANPLVIRYKRSSHTLGRL